MKSWLLHNLAAKYQPAPHVQVHVHISNLPKPLPISPPRQSLTLPELPAVVVFKDGGYFTYDGELFPLLVFQFVDGKKKI